MAGMMQAGAGTKDRPRSGVPARGTGAARAQRSGAPRPRDGHHTYARAVIALFAREAPKYPWAPAIFFKERDGA